MGPMDSLAAVSPGDILEEVKRRGLVVPASALETSAEQEPVSSGIDELDRACGGGLVRGGLVEVTAPSCGGATVLYALLAASSARGELCALVDPDDGFDVRSARDAGVALERLLWVRAPDRNGALRAAELILDAGGFRTVVVDLGLRRPGSRPAPAAAWLRLRRRAARGTRRPLLVVLSGGCETGTFASLAVDVARRRARFGGRPGGQRWLEAIELSFTLRKRRK